MTDTPAVPPPLLPPARGDGWEVKPLVWREERRGAWYARPDGLARYSVREPIEGVSGPRQWRVFRDGGLIAEVGSFEAAKAAAQADFESRVLACLVPFADRALEWATEASLREAIAYLRELAEDADRDEAISTARGYRLAAKAIHRLIVIKQLNAELDEHFGPSSLRPDDATLAQAARMLLSAVMHPPGLDLESVGASFMGEEWEVIEGFLSAAAALAPSASEQGHPDERGARG